jgi:PAS domain-containing protein
LKDPNIYREQIHRMLADPKAKALGERFAVQWLDLERLGAEVKPDSKQFPEFDPELQKAMLGEAVETFNHVISADRPLLELIDTDYVFVNERLAKLYGIPGVKGRVFTRWLLRIKTAAE